MINVDGLTIPAAFQAAASRYRDNPLVMLPRDAKRAYHPDGFRISYGEAATAVQSYADAFAEAGYGHGSRIAFLLANRPEILLYKLACASLGISWVPLNPDYRAAEMAYVLQNSGVELLISAPDQAPLAKAAIAASERNILLIMVGDAIPTAKRTPPHSGPIMPETEASLLYTSGTTGRPKGCILSHEYELQVGAWYAGMGGISALREGQERVYNPLPLFHLNAAIVSFFGMLLMGNCQITTDRFSRSNWAREVRETGATGMHYLGVIIPALMNLPPSSCDRDHGLRWGLGAGVEPSLHGDFEARFGYPLLELWGMTEACRVFANVEEPRHVDTRAFGRPRPGMETRIVDQVDNDVPLGEPGEMLIRYSADTPRKHFFSGYLNLPEETEDAWRGGWFHTGDTVSQDSTGMLYFVDRKKNIIRRSGENIAAAEIEACLQGHVDVAAVAVLAIEDETRDEEVMACIVINTAPNGPAAPDAALARKLFDYAFERLAYYKAPGWLVFVDEIPLTGTQKVQKHMIFAADEDPRRHANAHDFRALKKR